VSSVVCPFTFVAHLFLLTMAGGGRQMFRSKGLEDTAGLEAATAALTTAKATLKAAAAAVNGSKAAIDELQQVLDTKRTKGGRVRGLHMHTHMHTHSCCPSAPVLCLHMVVMRWCALPCGACAARGDRLRGGRCD
jgi:hypothetical protein